MWWSKNFQHQKLTCLRGPISVVGTVAKFSTAVNGTTLVVCGVNGVKGKVPNIKKTFDVPVDTYTVTLDFIKIDSWHVRCVTSHMVYVGINVCHA